MRNWLIAALAIAVIVCGVFLGLMGSSLSGTRAEVDYWRAEAEGQWAEADYWENQYQSIQEPRHFNSLQELNTWLAEDDTDSYAYVPTYFDCDGFALTLQRHALEDGYIISCEVDLVRMHMLNTAVIGNVCYLIEPQTDEVSVYCYLD